MPIAPMHRLTDEQMAQLNNALIKVVGPEPLMEGRLIEPQDLVLREPDATEVPLIHLQGAHFRRRKESAVQDSKGV